MRRRTMAAIAAATTAGSLVAGGVALAKATPGLGTPPWGLGGRGGMMGMMGTGMMGTRGQAMFAGDADQWFIREMIPHHEDAVAMADLALAQAEHAEIKALAQQIKSAQAQEIVQMRAWYQAWYGTAEVPPGVMDQMHESMAPMMALMQRMMGGPMMGGRTTDAPSRGFDTAAGPMGAMHADPTSIDGARPFDKAFIEQMIPHHQMAVMMATHVLPGAERPDLLALLQSIITMQSAEIRQMQTWYRAWYGG